MDREFLILFKSHKFLIFEKKLKEAVLKLFRKDSNFEKLDLNLFYPTTQDAIQLIFEGDLTEKPIICESISSHLSDISFYQKNLILKDAKSSSSFSGESATDKEDLSHFSNSSTDVI